MSQLETVKLRQKRLRAALRELSKPPVDTNECSRIRNKLAEIEIELLFLKRK